MIAGNNISVQCSNMLDENNIMSEEMKTLPEKCWKKIACIWHDVMSTSDKKKIFISGKIHVPL